MPTESWQMNGCNFNVLPCLDVVTQCCNYFRIIPINHKAQLVSLLTITRCNKAMPDYYVGISIFFRVGGSGRTSGPAPPIRHLGTALNHTTRPAGRCLSCRANCDLCSTSNTHRNPRRHSNFLCGTRWSMVQYEYHFESSRTADYAVFAVAACISAYCALRPVIRYNPVKSRKAIKANVTSKRRNPSQESLTVRSAYAPDAFPGPRLVDTPYGRIQVFEWGPEQGEKVLLMHGIGTPCVALANMAHEFVRRGCRVMVFGMSSYS